MENQSIQIQQLKDGIKNNNIPISAESKTFESGFFSCRTANQCIEDAKNQPNPKKLYHDLLIENELTILFADTGVGKSVFAVQIAHEISKTHKVLYLDLELSDKQFQGRYSEDFKNEFIFNENFLRVCFKRRFKLPDKTSYEEYFVKSLIELIQKSGSQVIIIDNMTKLISSDTDQAHSAKPLMDSLNDLKFDYNLTMLLLEHTKKVDTTRPIHLNDLQGSKMKSNFSDAIFTIGRSHYDKNLRYLKQLKVRSGELVYDTENVIVYEMIKENSFLKLDFKDYGSEFHHLKQLNNDDKSEIIEAAKNLRKEGYTIRDIAKKLNIASGTVSNYLKK